MNQLKKLAIILSPTLFLVGLWWGLRDHHFSPGAEFDQEKHLKILSLPNFFSDELKTRLRSETNIQLEIKEVQTPRELLQASDNPSYDMVMILSPQVHLNQTRETFQSFDWTEVNDSLSALSADFIGLPFNDDKMALYPLAWDYYGIWRFQPSDKDSEEGHFDLVEFLKLPTAKGIIEQNAREILSWLERMKLIEKEWLEPEQADMVKTALDNFRARVDIVEKVSSDSFKAPYNLVFGLSTVEPSDKQWKWLWSKQPASLWIYFIGLKNPKKRPQALELYQFLSRPQNALLMIQSTHLRTPLKSISQLPVDQTGDGLHQAPLANIKLSSGLASGEFIWDKILESHLNGTGNSELEGDGAGSGDDL